MIDDGSMLVNIWVALVISGVNGFWVQREWQKSRTTDATNFFPYLIVLQNVCSCSRFFNVFFLSISIFFAKCLQFSSRFLSMLAKVIKLLYHRDFHFHETPHPRIKSHTPRSMMWSEVPPVTLPHHWSGGAGSKGFTKNRCIIVVATERSVRQKSSAFRWFWFVNENWFWNVEIAVLDFGSYRFGKLRKSGP